MDPNGAEARRDFAFLGHSDSLRPKVYNSILDFPKIDQIGRFTVYSLYPFSNNIRFYMDHFATQSISPKWGLIYKHDAATILLRGHLKLYFLLPSPEDIEAPGEVNHVPEVKHSSGDRPLNIMVLWP